MVNKRRSGDDKRTEYCGFGLTAKEQGNKIHIIGTVSYDGRSVRIRKGTGLDKDVEANWKFAKEIGEKIGKSIKDELLHGIKPRMRVSELALNYLKDETPGPTDINAVVEILNKFDRRWADSITKHEFEEFYRKRFPNHSTGTIRRHQNTLFAMYSHSKISMPDKYEKKKVPVKRGSAMKKQFSPEESKFLILNCAPNIKPITALLHDTGARVGTTIYLHKTDFILAKGKGRVFFEKGTKTGNNYSRAITDFTVDIITEWLETRTDNHPEMFLTRMGAPYAYRIGRGGHIKTGFGTSLGKLCAYLIEDGHEDRARFLASATPHWFRHTLGNELRGKGYDLATIADAGMWDSMETPKNYYLYQEDPRTETALRERDLTNVGEIGDPKVIKPVSWNK